MIKNVHGKTVDHMGEAIVVMHGRTSALPDDLVYLEIAAEKTHVFDDTSGVRLN
jgi:hypothetical protein